MPTQEETLDKALNIASSLNTAMAFCRAIADAGFPPCDELRTALLAALKAMHSDLDRAIAIYESNVGAS